MKCIEKAIPEELKDLVSCIMYMHEELPDKKKFIYYHPPTPQTGFCFHLNGNMSVLKKGFYKSETQPQTVVVGPQTSPVVIFSENPYSHVRVGLLPGALYRLTSISQVLMVDQSFDAAEIFGDDILGLNKELALTSEPEIILEAIVQFLIKLMPKSLKVHQLDAQMHSLWKDPNPKRICEIAKVCNLSLRQFERLSLLRLGMRPKLYEKIIRFSKAYSSVERKEYENWTDLAYKSNYYDQRHLKKEFKVFTGKQLAKLKEVVSQNSVLIHGQLRY
ncbi:helix-turn-helix domain-containing protein [Algoriphagus pacificus]|uniref:HTH araC/xylS-type domain-containing protein n=1 Tax=Algoriphagus pacificus TaxID=2811234 RepID=A0ABS3CIR8_9BACT|nr:hypothetical protein [Algoriphagus pacificus]MBN7816996.1 hypothetical protein [Algoriphagus pacificus]